MARKTKAVPVETPVVTQDDAVEQAFVAGTLPEEDRREEDRRAPEVEPAIVEPELPPVVAVVPAPVAATPYVGQRFRVHDPVNPYIMRWADESGNLLP